MAVRTVSEDQRRLTESLTRFGNFLGLVALVALLLGGLGVASAVHVFVKRRMTTIAVLRCLGASSGTVLRAYLAQALFLGLAGGLVGAVLGAAAQLALPRLLRGVLPVDVAWSLSWPAVLSGVGVGVWVALVFSLLPLVAVRRVSPLAVLRRDFEEERPRRDRARLAAVLALAASLVALAVIQAGRPVFGLAFAAGAAIALVALWLAAFGLVRALRRFLPARLPFVYRQGLANLYRPANQTLRWCWRSASACSCSGRSCWSSTTSCASCASTAEPRGRTWSSSTCSQTSRRTSRLRSPPSGRSPHPSSRSCRCGSTRSRAARSPSCSRSRTSRSAPSAGRCAASTAAATATRRRPRNGSSPAPGGGPANGRRRSDGPVPIAVEAGLARELRLELGDEVVWDVQGVALPTRVAVLREVEWARFEPNFFVLFPEGPLDGAPRTSVLLARVEDAATRARLQRDVVAAHPNVSTLDLAQIQSAIEAVLDKIALAIRFMALFSLAAGALVLAGAVAASRYQRVREGALLRTLGARRPQLVRILLAEYAVLGALSALAALLLAIAAGWALVRFVFDGTFALPAQELALLVASVVVLTIVVGLAGSTEVWRRPPLEVLRAE